MVLLRERCSRCIPFVGHRLQCFLLGFCCWGPGGHPGGKPLGVVSSPAPKGSLLPSSLLPTTPPDGVGPAGLLPELSLKSQLGGCGSTRARFRDSILLFAVGVFILIFFFLPLKSFQRFSCSSFTWARVHRSLDSTCQKSSFLSFLHHQH